LFAGRIEVTPERLLEGKLESDAVRKIFVLGLATVDRLADFDVPSIESGVRRIADVLGIKLRDLVRPYYVAVSGSPQSLPLFDSMELLGRDLVRERLRFALERLGGATNAENDAWKKLLDAEPAAI
jgi:glutamyl-tRNA synthetase